MKNDEMVVAKLPKEEKDELVELGGKLDITLGQITREALQRFKPTLIERAAEKERAIAVPAEA